jgi:hypothetical protein
VPLESLPLQILGEGWRGENVPLDPDVKQRAKVAAYVQRTYQGDRASLWFYVGYVDRWVPEAIHHPDVCFPGSGFEQIAKNAITVPDATIGTPLNFREYLWNSPRGGGTYTLSTFYYNGKFEPDEWKLALGRHLRRAVLRRDNDFGHADGKPRGDARVLQRSRAPEHASPARALCPLKPAPARRARVFSLPDCYGLRSQDVIIFRVC